MANKDRRLKDSASKSRNLGQAVSSYTDRSLYQLSRSGFSQNLDEEEKIILDLCCGKGMATKPFRGKGTTIYYLDLSSEMIEAGRKEGYIKAPQDRVILDQAENILKNKKLIPMVSKFDAVVSRFSFHDFTDETYKLFQKNKPCFYYKGQKYQKKMLAKIYRVLRTGGEFQIIDTAVPPCKSMKVKNLYNKYHMLKTSGDPIGVHIPKGEELLKIAGEENFEVVNEAWYGSKVQPTDWYQEGQITRNRLKYLEELFREASADPDLKKAFNIKVKEEIQIVFPVIVLTLMKRGNQDKNVPNCPK